MYFRKFENCSIIQFVYNYIFMLCIRERNNIFQSSSYTPVRPHFRRIHSNALNIFSFNSIICQKSQSKSKTLSSLRFEEKIPNKLPENGKCFMNFQLFAIARAVYAVRYAGPLMQGIRRKIKYCWLRTGWREELHNWTHTASQAAHKKSLSGGVHNWFCRSIWGCTRGSDISWVNSATKWTTKSIFFEWKVCFSFSNVFFDFHASILLFFGYTNFAPYQR